MGVLCFRMIGIRLSGAVRLAYLRSLFSQPVKVIDTLPSGQITATVTAKANELQLGISEKLGQFIQASALMIGSIAVSFRYSWLLTLVTSGVLVFIVLVQVILQPLNRKRSEKIDGATAKATAIASEALSSIRMIVACGAEDRILARHGHWTDEARRQEHRFSPLVSLQFSPLIFAVYSNTTLTFWFGIHEYLNGQIANVGTIVVVLMSILSIFSSIGQLIAPLELVSRASRAAVDFFTLIDRTHHHPPGLCDAQRLANLDITFKNVHFAYPSRPQVKVLNGLDVSFESGKVTAIVGPSGSGKSTIVGLIQKWYSLREQNEAISDLAEATQDGNIELRGLEAPLIRLEGNVCVGDTDLEEVETKSWRRNIGLVAQTPFLFNDTIRNNVLFGLQGSQWEHADQQTKERMLKEACKEAYADEFISRLPQGYDTAVGDVGIKLSGGQRQRLAIARSIIKNPSILILDEATSAMDVQSEQIVQAALDRVSQTRTTIIIAHRLSTIKKADKIVVMKSGQVVEQGTHEALVNNKGAYSELVNAQRLSMHGTEVMETASSSFPISGPFADDSTTNLIHDMDSQLSLSIPWSPSAYEGSVGMVEKPIVEQKRLGLFHGLGLLIGEQKHLAPLYAMTLIGAMIAGAGLPVQSYVAANFINVFLRPKQDLVHEGNRWALYSFILALAVGAGYAIIGYSGSEVSASILRKYRQEYFENIIRQQIPFFDDERHPAGTLVGRLTNDTVQLQQLLGLNMIVVLVGFFNVVGCIALSFAFGWRLALVNLAFSFPLCILAGFFRLRFERKLEEMYANVFAESSKFAAESISNYRTVISLTMEQAITERYDVLLQQHARTAFYQSLYSTFTIAFGDSIALATQALLSW
ncbi:hypothetical protein THARTR1_10284 [Trichoderma harzianum]|uniref:ABC transporter n=1 Tax=Trichoderma harzianum TaxID=5544 RepID=A0A2K0TTH9_TRIHA|nr:hypothetical protein THARTR1_10284 [Trichoderma harzianum]